MNLKKWSFKRWSKDFRKNPLSEIGVLLFIGSFFFLVAGGIQIIFKFGWTGGLTVSFVSILLAWLFEVKVTSDLSEDK